MTVGNHIGDKSRRIEAFDVAKCVGMGLVCTCHCYYITIRNLSVVNLAAVSVAMPLFMLVCGFFSHSAMRMNLRSLVLRKLLPLAVPVVTCSVCFALLNLLWGSFSVASVAEVALSCLWFLRALAVILCVAWVALRLPVPQWLAALLSVAVLLAVPGGSAWQVNYLIILFWVGYFLRIHYRYVRPRMAWMAQASVGVYLICALTGFVHGQYHFSHWMMMNFPFALMAQVVVGVSGSLAVISLAHLACDRVGGSSPLVTAVARVGRYTLGIYLVQTVLLQYVGYHYAMALSMRWAASLPLWLADYVLTPLMGALTVIICYFVVRLISRRKLLSRILFGTSYS